MSDRPRILVLGSVNMDVVIRTPRSPRGGETVVAEDLMLYPGGKGANQAVAAARLGAEVTFVGRVGSDDWGLRLGEQLRENDVSTEHLRTSEACATGNATIIVEPSGENRILLVEGANAEVTSADVDAALESLDTAGRMPDRILAQLEIPPETVFRAIARAEELGIPFVLDAGPPQSVPLERLRGLEILSPNESETEALTGIRVETDDDARRAAEALEEATEADAIVLKLGERGAWIRSNGADRLVPAYRVAAIDTTAAGDSFTAALTIEQARGTELLEAVEIANAAGALATIRHGAQPSLPTAAELEAFLDETR